MRLTRELRNQFIQHEMRTHGRKNGFVTAGQEARLRKWLPAIGLEKGKRLSDAHIPAGAPIMLEVGFGNGEFMAAQLQQHPAWYMLGIEIYLPGVAKCIGRLEDGGVIDRGRVTQLPAQYVLEHQVAESQLDGIFVNHPDPWPKARHHKRRIIQKPFAELMVTRLKAGGFIKLASDKPDLADWMRDILDETPGLTNVAGKGNFVPREAGRIHTKFEQRGLREGRKSRFLHYIKEKENT